ncbi:MAG: RsmG family class I SAM-dependent methyltransferase [Actinomycetota bacterium]
MGPHLQHARGFAILAESLLDGPPVVFADLGSGGGLPGLVLASAWPASAATLIESHGRRATALCRFAAALGLSASVSVVAERGEIAAHQQEHRERYDLVTARSFGPPAVTAEIGAGFVRLGGWLVVSEPPGPVGERWPVDGLEVLGFGPAVIASASGASYMGAEKQRPALSETPRNSTRLAKRPLW